MAFSLDVIVNKTGKAQFIETIWFKHFCWQWNHANNFFFEIQLEIKASLI